MTTNKILYRVWAWDNQQESLKELIIETDNKERAEECFRKEVNEYKMFNHVVLEKTTRIIENLAEATLE